MSESVHMNNTCGARYDVRINVCISSPISILGVNMSVKDDVIKAMKEAGKPMSAGEVEKATGIDRKEIDKAFKELKAEGAIVSPVRCKWEPAQ